MPTIKNILCILFVFAIIYGMIEARSIAYCCGHCCIDSIALAEDTHSCCDADSKNAEEQPNCEKHPCQVVSFESDWDIYNSNSVHILPALPVFNVLFSVTSIVKHDFHFFLPAIQAKRGSPFLLATPQEYLSFIRVLLI